MSMLDDAKKFPKMEVNEERKGVLNFTLQSITRGVYFIHTLEIVYIETEDSGKKRRKKEIVVLPPVEIVTVDVAHCEGLKTVISHFPVQIISNETWNSTPVHPYVGMDGREAGIPCKLKLVLLSDMFEACSIVVDKE